MSQISTRLLESTKDHQHLKNKLHEVQKKNERTLRDLEEAYVQVVKKCDSCTKSLEETLTMMAEYRKELEELVTVTSVNSRRRNKELVKSALGLITKTHTQVFDLLLTYGRCNAFFVESNTIEPEDGSDTLYNHLVLNAIRPRAREATLDAFQNNSKKFAKLAEAQTSFAQVINEFFFTQDSLRFSCLVRA